MFAKPSKQEESKDQNVNIGGPGGPAVENAAVTSDELLRVDVLPLKQHVLKGVSNKVPVLFNIVTSALPEQQVKKRSPLNLAIVLDRSGSMCGPKLENAKRAVIKVVENMNTEDLLHLVVYGSRVQTVFSNATLKNKDKLITQVKAIEDQGCTNLSGGLEEGVALVNKHHKKDYSKRVYLFSDGLANEGIQSVEGMSKLVRKLHNEGGIKIDSFGIGDDFDSNMMKCISEYGSGEFFFIDSAEAIPKLVSKALEGLLEMVGSDTVLTLRGTGDGIVRKIFGKDDQALVTGATLGDLHQSNVRQVMAEVEVASKNIGSTQVLEWELSYVGRSAAEGQRTVLQGTLELTVTDDKSIVTSEKENAEVGVSLAIQQAGESDTTIQKYLAAGKVNEAMKAQNLQIEQLTSVESADATGMVKMMKSMATTTLAKLQSQGASKEVRKRYSHGAYMKRRGSFQYCSKYS